MKTLTRTPKLKWAGRGLVRGKTAPAQEPEERHGKQGADDHRQPRKKADLLLMPGQLWLSPASGLVCHNSRDYTGSRCIGHGVFTPSAQPMVGLYPMASASGSGHAS